MKRDYVRRQFNSQVWNVRSEVMAAATKIGGHFDPAKAKFSANKYGNVIMSYPIRQQMPRYNSALPVSHPHQQSTHQPSPPRKGIRSRQQFPLGRHPLIARALVKYLPK